jgi:hypothetical protein
MFWKGCRGQAMINPPNSHSNENTIKYRIIYNRDSMDGSSEIRTTILSTLTASDRPVSIAGLSRKTGISRNTLSKYLDGLVVSGRVGMIQHGMAKKFYLREQDNSASSRKEPQDLIVVLDSSRCILIFDKIDRKEAISCLGPGRTEDLPFPRDIAEVLESGQFLQWLSRVNSSPGSQHSLYEIKKTDDTAGAMTLAYRAFPLFFAGTDPLVVMYTKRGHDSTPTGSQAVSLLAADDITTEERDCIVILQDMHIVHASPSFARLIGRPLDSIKGCNIKRFFQASSINFLENSISTLGNGMSSTLPPLELTLMGNDTQDGGVYAFHLGRMPYPDAGAVIGVLRRTGPRQEVSLPIQAIPSGWENFLRELLTRLQIREREASAVLVPWALEQLHPLLDADECVLDIQIRELGDFRGTFRWSASQDPQRQGSADSGTIERGQDELLQVPIRKNKNTLGRFGWHPRSPDMIPPIDRQSLETVCTLLALKVWHQQCIERSMESQTGFNDTFGEISE